MNAALEILAQLLLRVARDALLVDTFGVLQERHEVVAHDLEQQCLLRTMPCVMKSLIGTGILNQGDPVRR